MSNINKQTVQAVADLKAGYTLGHADVELIQQMALDAVTILDELEAKQKSNDFLKGQLAELANFNPDWDKLEASYESWREIAAELLVAKDRIAELEAESEERRQFILNGVEMGFIRLPDKDTRDPATATYERCLSGIQYTPCPKCNDTGMADSGGTQPWGEPIEIECDCRQQDANTAELVAAGIITKVGE
ncbi:hypothetical protein ACX27D_08440 [Enterobacter hormaechei]|nr:hypothetical protein [Enterobacter hormaechei]